MKNIQRTQQASNTVYSTSSSVGRVMPSISAVRGAVPIIAISSPHSQINRVYKPKRMICWSRETVGAQRWVLYYLPEAHGHHNNSVSTRGKKRKRDSSLYHVLCSYSVAHLIRKCIYSYGNQSRKILPGIYVHFTDPYWRLLL